ncbi:MAG: 1-acyl-sn-glycerol-3-phosphate acyltransferase [Bacteroidales bacterium]|nr:1-acyl-sn-glycerol-3-phosphate acyltransferase [Bacteroidales bacterium]
MNGSEQIRIDIGKVLKDKNPRLYGMVPGLMINYLRKIVHEDELNEFFRDFGHLQGIELVKAGLTYLAINYKVHNKNNIPATGRNIFISNHPLGGLDGLIFMLELSKHFNDIKVPVNDILMNVTNMHKHFLPINKHGAQDRDAAVLLEKAYASDSQIIYFPAGLCSRKKKGAINDLKWHKNFLIKAIKHKRDIVPVHFSGRNSNFFYNLSNIRASLGIKANLEMLYLADEMFKQKNADLHIVFGESIPWEKFDKSKNPVEWTEWLKTRTYELAADIPV